MIVVLGRPALAAAPTDAPTGGPTGAQRLGEDSSADAIAASGGSSWLAGPVALAASGAGGQVELVGTIGDDPEGDLVVVALGRGGVGHAALLRDPGGRTPVDRAAGVGAGRDPDTQPLPRLDARDVELGLGYLIEYRVLVLVEQLAEEAEAVALEAAAYHGAQLVALVPEGRAVSERLAASATVLETPSEPGPRFAELVGRYAAALDVGTDAARAFAEAVRATGWESIGD